MGPHRTLGEWLLTGTDSQGRELCSRPPWRWQASLCPTIARMGAEASREWPQPGTVAREPVLSAAREKRVQWNSVKNPWLKAEPWKHRLSWTVRHTEWGRRLIFNTEASKEFWKNEVTFFGQAWRERLPFLHWEPFLIFFRYFDGDPLKITTSKAKIKYFSRILNCFIIFDSESLSPGI